MAAESGPDERVTLVRVAEAGVALEGELVIPRGARGIVLFAHGSGSSRHSPRNRFTAEVLRSSARVATLLFDLLSPDEDREDALMGLRFDVGLLARRLVAATDWARRMRDTAHLRVGYFGASTGAAAALTAAAARRDVAAIVSRGGRPDLAGPAVLARVHAPVLLIVGGEDHAVVEMNRSVLGLLRCPRELAIVPGATHLFEEPGARDEVARLAAEWFRANLVGA
jgi:dienelactone hydrolase